MIVVAPGVTPVTMPLKEPINAVVGWLLVQVPPLTLSVSGVVAPAHALPAPVIAVGPLLTVTVLVVEQPVGRV